MYGFIDSHQTFRNLNEIAKITQINMKYLIKKKGAFVFQIIVRQ